MPWREVRWLGAAILLAAAGGCAKGDFATVAIVYQSATPQVDLPSLETPARLRIVTAFNAFTSAHGYKCQPGLKRPEEILCRGPRNMNVTFVPELNRHAFVARFNWLEIGGRSREEFERHTSEFVQALENALPDVELQIVHERA
jgi:hypothetical protein